MQARVRPMQTQPLVWGGGTVVYCKVGVSTYLCMCSSNSNCMGPTTSPPTDLGVIPSMSRVSVSVPLLWSRWSPDGAASRRRARLMSLCQSRQQSPFVRNRGGPLSLIRAISNAVNPSEVREVAGMYPSRIRAASR